MGVSQRGGVANRLVYPKNSSYHEEAHRVWTHINYIIPLLIQVICMYLNDSSFLNPLGMSSQNQ